MDVPNRPCSPLLELPAELIQQVLSSLPPSDLCRLSRTCRLLRSHASDERLWKPIVLSNTHSVRFDANPPRSWRKLFQTHEPYWFLPRRKLWFADTAHTGKLVLARYNPIEDCIEAHSIVAERLPNTFELWEHNPEVIIHTFSPKVQLDRTTTVVRLNRAAYSQPADEGKLLQRELAMEVHNDAAGHGLFSLFMLARPVPYDIVSRGSKVWPPLTIPAAQRTRNESVTRFRGTGHKPARLAELSDTTWRLRKWMSFSHPHPLQNNGAAVGGGFTTARVGEDVTTFASLDPQLYTPTPQKPWRGIWCGDYAGHGCEFLLVLQPDDPAPLPEGAMRALARRDSSASTASSSSSSVGSWASVQSHLQTSDEDDEEFVDLGSTTGSLDASTATVLDGDQYQAPEQQRVREKRRREDELFSGRIEAVKLTGDPNIPRGEYTFIAPDIGPEGFVRTAEEEIFRGARVVKSVGHIAARGYRDDEFISSQLIMISHDRLAQYWVPFGHISFYQRVDVDALLNS
ncbi:hypothetical protein BK809_0002646 [Diplodia seriata]|uniref:F-box domain-containing protein n=1 Tax=Diplodia seriata TaxID=420778 RepID=A0A1S8B2M5_9PEZI|nr:hypothetical protein BK809_0002646 [Diplodia seriata]